MEQAINSKVIDADAHVIETEKTWDYLEPSERKFRPQIYGSPDDSTRQYWVLDGKIRGFRFATLTEQQLEVESKKAGRSFRTPQAARELDDVDLRLAHLDKLGIGVQILHNTMWIEQVTDQSDAEIALCMSWNRWMSDVWKKGRGRLRWSCVVPAMTIEESLRQMRFAKENGSVAVCLRPLETGRHLVDPYFYPIYDEATRLDMALAIHIANASPGFLDYLSPRYDKGGGLAPFRLPAIMTCFSLIMSEIPRVFPDLRWGFIESSAQWVPWIVNETIRRSGASGQRIPRNPLNAFKIYITAQTDDDFPFIFKYAGEDNIIIGTDYGHTDASSEIDAITVFKGLKDVSDLAKQKVLSDNPRALFAL